MIRRAIKFLFGPLVNWATPKVNEQPETRIPQQVSHKDNPQHVVKHYRREYKFKYSPKKSSAMPPEMMEAAHRLYISGATPVLMEKELGVSKYTIMRHWEKITKRPALGIRGKPPETGVVKLKSMAELKTVVPVQQKGGNPVALEFINAFKPHRGAAITSREVYSILSDTDYMSAWNVKKLLHKRTKDVPSIQACLSKLARNGVLHRVANPSHVKGFIYRRYGANESVKITTDIQIGPSRKGKKSGGVTQIHVKPEIYQALKASGDYEEIQH